MKMSFLLCFSCRSLQALLQNRIPNLLACALAGEGTKSRDPARKSKGILTLHLRTLKSQSGLLHPENPNPILGANDESGTIT